MKGKHILTGSLVAGLFLALAVSLTQAQGPQPPGAVSSQATTGTAFTYQGQLKENGFPVNGTCDFQFSLYDADGGGTQIGTTETKTNVQVNDGLFTVQLDFGSGAFQGDARWLEIAVRCPAGSGTYTTLTPRQALTAVPYALFSLDTTPYANVVTVAKSGGDFTSIQEAINSITDASADNPYLVWVAPGVYNETVTLKPYVHLQGAGKGNTIVQADAPGDETLVLASDTSLRDLTVNNVGTGGTSTCGVYGDSISDVELANVEISVDGANSYNYALFLNNSTATLDQVTATAANASTNIGLLAASGASVSIYGGLYTAQYGNYAYGVQTGGTNTFVGTADVYAEASGASNTNAGFHNTDSASAFLQGGYFRASGGNYAYGVLNENATLEAEGITALGEQGALSAGIRNDSNIALTATVVSRGGSIIARGGSSAHAVYNSGDGDTIIELHHVALLAENATGNNHGIANYDTAKVYGGTITSRGGSYSRAIFFGGGQMEIQGVYAFGDQSTYSSYGLLVAGPGSVNADSCRFKGTYAVRMTTGILNLAVSQVDGGITRSGGTLNCFQVYDENYTSYTCP
ncbi:MAG TPA: hypothetical protein G4O00_13315 [Thermoflexia bacterium]|jgi:hypothetical protein|nr:hypothetical protein [Thermoflexia bacterium]